MDYLDKVSKNKKATKYSWQQKALDLWEKMNITGRPNASYFKCFKDNVERATEAAYYTSDSHSANPLNTFFWKYNHVND